MQQALVVVMFVAGGVATAAAQPLVAPPPDPERAVTTEFVTLDRYDASSRLGAEVSYEGLEDVSGTLLRLNVFGQYVDPGTHLGGYASLPMAVGLGLDGLDNTFALSGAEVGGLYVVPLSRAGSGIVGHVGLVLPTAASDDDLLSIISSFGRPSEIYNAVPQALSLRLGASPIVRSGRAFGRLDLGLDINLSSDRSNVESWYRFGAGGGVDLGAVSLMAELSGARSSTKGNTFANGALSARYTAGTLHPYVAVGLPLDDMTSTLFSAIVTIGVDGALR